ncbi:MAG: HD domain-containing protein [Candidatus Pacebacteria bacterium]|nr:HD domain-containing protein [Candidatus Paceibacterota bacterium]
MTHSKRKEVKKMKILCDPAFPESRPILWFGQHPEFQRAFKKWQREVKRGKSPRAVPLADIFRVGKIHLIPRNQYIEVVDDFGDRITTGSPDNAILPFSSYDLFADIYEDPYFKEFLERPFFRLGGISQLGYLVPPRPEDWKLNATMIYSAPYFVHTRWAHSRLVAFLMEAILAKHGYPEKERFPVVLASAYHDIATPAGGDSVKRVDSEGLDEEDNFEWVLRHYGLVQKWSDEYGFDIEIAKDWVKGTGLFGRVLDIVDRMAYTSLDSYYVGSSRPCKLRTLGLKNPLVMDVWQDLKFNDDRTNFAFTDPNRLFKFLLFRAYEHEELLMNPYSRALDFLLQQLVQPLYESGIITREQLLLSDDGWLYAVLQEHYPDKNVWCFLEPESLSWKKFDELEELKRFCSINGAVDHVEYMKGFDTGLNLGVYSGKKIVPARELLSGEQVEELEEISGQIRGYYAYCIKE